MLLASVQPIQPHQFPVPRLILFVLQSVEHARVLRLSNVAELWPHGSVGDVGAFDAAYDRVRRGWCCTDKNEAPIVDLAGPTKA